MNFIEKNQTFVSTMLLLTSIKMKFGSKKSLNSEQLTIFWTQPNGGYTLAQKLVSSGAYHRPTCDSEPSHEDIA